MDPKLENPNQEMTESVLLALLDELEQKSKAMEKAYGGEPQWFVDHPQLYRDFIEKLLLQKDGFKNIFITENGSYYFVLHNGQTLRIKSLKYDFEPQALTDEISFSDEQGRPCELQVGSKPFEIIREKPNDKIPEEKWHRGHKVIKIIKKILIIKIKYYVLPKKHFRRNKKQYQLSHSIIYW